MRPTQRQTENEARARKEEITKYTDKNQNELRDRRRTRQEIENKR